MLEKMILAKKNVVYYWLYRAFLIDYIFMH